MKFMISNSVNLGKEPERRFGLESGMRAFRLWRPSKWSKGLGYILP